MSSSKTFLCITCDFKGTEFINALKALGHTIYLVTSESTRGKPWPYENIEEAFYMPEADGRLWNMDHLIKGVAHIFRLNRVDKVIALDDYDVWKASTLREEFRSPGMGQTTARHFYDKLSMRMIAEENDILIPGYSDLFNDETIHRFLESSPGPWVVKPRMDAGALGIRKLKTADDFWAWNEEHREERHGYLIEEFKPGAVYHVDSLFQDYKSLFTRSSRYLQPPFEIAHEGGLFRSQTIDAKDKESKELKKFNDRLLKAFKLNFGASHSEFIRCNEDDKFYFLETSARVGGAHLAEMVEAASGINLWEEWAKLESSMLTGEKYVVPKETYNNAGILVTLSRYENPDYQEFSGDPHLWWTMNKSYHVGFIFKDKNTDLIKKKLDDYARVVNEKFHTSVPLKE